MVNLIRLGTSLIILSLILSPVYAGNITARAGTTWVRWEWNLSVWNVTNNTTINVLVDNRVAINNSSSAFYYTLTGVNPLEEHIIEITYSANNTTIETLISKTGYPSTITYLLIIIVFTICIFMLFMREPFTLILFGCVNIILSLYIATTSWKDIGSLSVIGYLTATYSGIIVIVILWVIMREKMRWG